VEDTCGCPRVVLNGTNQALVDQVRSAYEAWVNAGCGPLDCDFCDPARGGVCQNAPTPQGGVCIGLTTF
jgi:hypothetical protein